MSPPRRSPGCVPAEGMKSAGIASGAITPARVWAGQFRPNITTDRAKPVARTHQGKPGTRWLVPEPKRRAQQFLRCWEESLTVAAVLLSEKPATRPTTQLKPPLLAGTCEEAGTGDRGRRTNTFPNPRFSVERTSLLCTTFLHYSVASWAPRRFSTQPRNRHGSWQ